MNQPQDSGAAPEPVSGQPGSDFGAAGQTQPYGTPAGQGYPSYPPPGYSQPGNQAYPSYGQTQPYGTPAGQGYPSYPQPGYGQPGNQAYPSYPQPGYGQPYQSYGYQTATKDPALAEWWRRLLARIIDGLILAAIFSALLIPVWLTFFHQVTAISARFPSGAGTSQAEQNAMAAAAQPFIHKVLVVFVVFYLVVFAYDWIQHWLWGQTIGKRALGTKVVKEDGNPSIGAGSAAGRAAIYALAPAVPLVGGLFGLLNELWLTWDPRRQCLHDKAAHTVVIKKDYQLSRPQAGAW